MGWTNRNRTRIFNKQVGTATARLHDRDAGVECSSVTIQAVEGVKFYVAIGYDGIDEGPFDVSVKWTIPAKAANAPYTVPMTFRGITNTAQVSAWADSSSTDLQFIASFYDGQVLTG